jgi:hypothetical protein
MAKKIHTLMKGKIKTSGFIGLPPSICNISAISGIIKKRAIGRPRMGL